MAYRTRTYIAADWDKDKAAVDQLRKWNDSNYWGLSFTDAHDLTTARDESLNCSIKKSLKSRLDASNRFVLIVGRNTDKLKAGSCTYCRSYNYYTDSCARGGSVDSRSYIEYECEKAREAYEAGEMKIIVLYNSSYIYKPSCPRVLRDIGVHSPMKKSFADNSYFDYYKVKQAFGY